MVATDSYRLSGKETQLAEALSGAPEANGILVVDPIAGLSRGARWPGPPTTPPTCACGHTLGDHEVHNDSPAEGVRLAACTRCECRTTPGAIPGPVTQTAERRGQFWSLAQGGHCAWFLPFEPAPWETGRPAPVALYRGAAGRWHTDAWTPSVTVSGASGRPRLRPSWPAVVPRAPHYRAECHGRSDGRTGTDHTRGKDAQEQPRGRSCCRTGRHARHHGCGCASRHPPATPRRCCC